MATNNRAQWSHTRSDQGVVVAGGGAPLSVKPDSMAIDMDQRMIDQGRQDRARKDAEAQTRKKDGFHTSEHLESITAQLEESHAELGKIDQELDSISTEVAKGVQAKTKRNSELQKKRRECLDKIDSLGRADSQERQRLQNARQEAIKTAQERLREEISAQLKASAEKAKQVDKDIDRLNKSLAELEQTSSAITGLANSDGVSRNMYQFFHAIRGQAVKNLGLERTKPSSQTTLIASIVPKEHHIQDQAEIPDSLWDLPSPADS